MKKKSCMLALLISVSIMSWGQKNKNKNSSIAESKAPSGYELVGICTEGPERLTEMSTGLGLFRWTGAMPEEFGRISLATTSEKQLGFRVNMPETITQGIYFIGPDAQRVRPIVFNKDRIIKLNGSCLESHTMSVISNDQAYFDQTNQTIQSINNDFMGLLNNYRTAASNPLLVSDLDSKMKRLDQRKKKLIDSLRINNPLLHRYAQPLIYYSYQHNKLNLMQTEQMYFVENYLKQVDYRDSLAYQFTTFHETHKNYATNINQMGLNQQQQIDYLTQALRKMSTGTNNHRTALFAIALGNMGVNETNFIHFSKKYLELYTKNNTIMANFFAQRIAELKGKTPGEEITEITEVNPEGKTISTKSFKGKVLLIDFWASWCGPCRRVNPHLVQLYNKYKSAGFEVLGVSLDKSKDAWVQAIQQDGLTWSHVSDLGFWQSKWAKAYGVSSIPYAVLVDKEGKLIAAGIQPQELDQKLAQLFGF